MTLDTSNIGRTICRITSLIMAKAPSDPLEMLFADSRTIQVRGKQSFVAACTQCRLYAPPPLLPLWPLAETKVSFAVWRSSSLCSCPGFLSTHFQNHLVHKWVSAVKGHKREKPLEKPVHPAQGQQAWSDQINIFGPEFGLMQTSA